MALGSCISTYLSTVSRTLSFRKAVLLLAVCRHVKSCKSRLDSWLGAQDCRVFTTLFIRASGRVLLTWVALEPNFLDTARAELDSEEV